MPAPADLPINLLPDRANDVALEEIEPGRQRPINNVTHQVNLESKSALYNHLYAWLLTGCLGMIVLLTWHASSQACWAGIILYGIGNGPCVGYCCE